MPDQNIGTPSFIVNNSFINNYIYNIIMNTKIAIASIGGLINSPGLNMRQAGKREMSYPSGRMPERVTRCLGGGMAPTGRDIGLS